MQVLPYLYSGGDVGTTAKLVQSRLVVNGSERVEVVGNGILLKGLSTHKTCSMSVDVPVDASVMFWRWSERRHEVMRVVIPKTVHFMNTYAIPVEGRHDMAIAFETSDGLNGNHCAALVTVEWGERHASAPGG